MASRSDQLHSHQFTLQRVVGALAMRDPDPVSSPMRRIGAALFASVMVAVVAVAAVGVYGLLRPGGGNAWREGNAMIIEKETGARFVYRNGVLYPVLNYTSALLILGSAQPDAVQVSRAQLVGIPRGTPLGISGAPDPLPGPEQLVTDAWTVCSRPAASQPGTPANGVESVVRVGAPVAAETLGERGVLVADPSGGLHLLWHNRRYALAQPDLVLAGFTWSRSSVAAVPAGLLNVIPAGADLGPLPVPGRGQSSSVDGFRVGEVLVVANQSGGRLFGVVLANGIADITPVQADLLLTNGANSDGKAHEIGQAQYKQARRAPSLVPTGDGAPPETTPTQVRPAAQGGICVNVAPGTGAPVLALAAAVPAAPGEVRVRRPAGDPATLADWVAVPPGRGAVVEALASSAAPAGALAVVSDLGLRFPVPSRDVLTTLGYGGVAPQRLPAGLVALLPSGHALDPAAAALPANAGT